MWTNDLKIALVQQNFNKIDKLVSEMPEFDSLNEMEEAAYLLKNALELLRTKREEAKNSMARIKKNIDFMNSTSGKKKNKLNITT